MLNVNTFVATTSRVNPHDSCNHSHVWENLLSEFREYVLKEEKDTRLAPRNQENSFEHFISSFIREYVWVLFFFFFFFFFLILRRYWCLMKLQDLLPNDSHPLSITQSSLSFLSIHVYLFIYFFLFCCFYCHYNLTSFILQPSIRCTKQHKKPICLQ